MWREERGGGGWCVRRELNNIRKSYVDQHDKLDMSLLKRNWSFMRKRRWPGRRRWRRRKSWRCSTSPSTVSSTLASAPNASAAISWLGAAKEDRAARSCTANKSSITCQCHRSWLSSRRRSRRSLWRQGDGSCEILWQVCRSYHRMVRMLSCPFIGGNC